MVMPAGRPWPVALCARLTTGSDTGLPHLHLGTATINGRQLTVPYTYNPSASSPLNYWGEISIGQIYRCS
jgi:hypothetical protein